MISPSPMAVDAFYMLMTLNSRSKLVPAVTSAINSEPLHLAVSSTLLPEGIINISNVTYTKTSIFSCSLVIPFDSKRVSVMLRKLY